MVLGIHDMVGVVLVTVGKGRQGGWPHCSLQTKQHFLFKALRTALKYSNRLKRFLLCIVTILSNYINGKVIKGTKNLTTLRIYLHVYSAYSEHTVSKKTNIPNFGIDSFLNCIHKNKGPSTEVRIKLVLFFTFYLLCRKAKFS